MSSRPKPPKALAKKRKGKKYVPHQPPAERKAPRKHSYKERKARTKGTRISPPSHYRRPEALGRWCARYLASHPEATHRHIVEGLARSALYGARQTGRAASGVYRIVYRDGRVNAWAGHLIRRTLVSRLATKRVVKAMAAHVAQFVGMLPTTVFADIRVYHRMRGTIPSGVYESLSGSRGLPFNAYEAPSEGPAEREHTQWRLRNLGLVYTEFLAYLHALVERWEEREDETLIHRIWFHAVLLSDADMQPRRSEKRRKHGKGR